MTDELARKKIYEDFDFGMQELYTLLKQVGPFKWVKKKKKTQTITDVCILVFVTVSAPASLLTLHIH